MPPRQVPDATFKLDSFVHYAKQQLAQDFAHAAESENSQTPSAPCFFDYARQQLAQNFARAAKSEHSQTPSVLSAKASSARSEEVSEILLNREAKPTLAHSMQACLDSSHSPKMELPQNPNVQDLVDLLALEEQSLTGDLPNSETQPEILSEPDEDEIWKKFVLDDGEEINRKAYEKAQEDTVQQILLEDGTSAASVIAEPSSSLRVDLPGQISDVSEPPMSFIEELAAATTTDFLSEAIGSPSVTVVTSNGTANFFGQDWTDEAASQAAQHGTPSATSGQSSEFRFHHPAPFIGRLASTTSAQKPTGSPLKRGRGRPKRKRDVRRPDIRKLPDLHDDPIDDVSDE